MAVTMADAIRRPSEPVTVPERLALVCANREAVPSNRRAIEEVVDERMWDPREMTILPPVCARRWAALPRRLGTLARK
jgi:hypothetical protein